MVRFISFHSLKGGTGKTTLTSNVVVLSALRGRKVCLLDFDFRAPSLHVFFKSNPTAWLNDFLNGDCEFTEVTCDVDIGKTGKLTIGFANPSTEAMRDIMTKDRELEAEAFRRILSIKGLFLKDGCDLVIFDTSPGIQYSSINALAASNLIVLVMNRNELQREDVANVVDKVYKPLGREVGVALNKVLFRLPEDKAENLEKSSENENRKVDTYNKNLKPKAL